MWQYTLPHDAIDKSDWTTIEHDFCYSHTSDDDIAKIIYESIIDYAFNDSEIEEEQNLNDLQKEAIRTRIRFEEGDANAAQEKYGLYGEVIFNILLRVIFSTTPIIAKGYFYDILKPEENKGYDSFHIIKTEKSTGLWFGEMKFHQRYTSAIDSVYKNIQKALSNDYFRRNLLALLPKKHDLNIDNDTVKGIIKDLRANPEVNISDLRNKYNLKLVYPICIMCNMDTHPLASISIDVPIEIFFMLLPIDNAKNIKQTIIQWISSSQPLTLL